ncbi:hypothetical protein [Halarcobacter bivalviorum]|uniref:Uncharacterized protein n=1 Tax=Halarcobacter bivalviorum TaxID=663364 RepID=A0AAX2ACI1_9BACT|nr:hypothetical protein [Halarcobacter bivalviorum]AXH11660.1 hypothetical protein ABIV_0647 [Halarcobacter bivalviorum]RXK10793.1 hypothetical protein CRV05_00020 [Halarcobacter bivalviorum]
MLKSNYSIKKLLDNNSNQNDIRRIKKILKDEKVREQLTLNELLKAKNSDETHIKKLNSYLLQIKTNISKLNFLLEKLNVQRKIPKLNISSLTQLRNENKSFL